MAKDITSKAKVVAYAKQLSAGVDKHFGNVTITLRGAPFTAAQITTQLDLLETMRIDVETAKALVKAKIAVEQSKTPALRALVTALVSYVKGAYDGSPDVLADFGINPKQRAPMTIEAKAAAAAKRKATRAARRTMGPVQKRQVKGDVVGVELVPVTSATPVATPPATRGGPGAPPTHA